MAVSPGDTRDGNTFPGSFLVFSGKTGEVLWKVFAGGSPAHATRHTFLGDVNLDGLADFAVLNSLTNPDGTSGRIEVYAGAPGDAERYCDAQPNSTGVAARIELDGPISVGNDFLTLRATGAVPSQAGLFLYGPDVAQLPMGVGTLCVSGPLFRLGPPQTADAEGNHERAIVFSEAPTGFGPGRIEPGSTWSFQLWYRDLFGTRVGQFNFSDAYRIEFTP